MLNFYAASTSIDYIVWIEIIVVVAYLIHPSSCRSKLRWFVWKWSVLRWLSRCWHTSVDKED